MRTGKTARCMAASFPPSCLSLHPLLLRSLRSPLLLSPTHRRNGLGIYVVIACSKASKQRCALSPTSRAVSYHVASYCTTYLPPLSPDISHSFMPDESRHEANPSTHPSVRSKQSIIPNHYHHDLQSARAFSYYHQNRSLRISR